MRKLKLLLLFTPFILSIACINPQRKQEELASYNFTQKKLNDNFYVLKAPNYNTNTGVFIGSDAILLIDPMTGFDSHQNLLGAIEQLSSKPIKYVLNTHSHMDHSGANKFFSELGATIISHENAKYSNALYDVTFEDTFTVELGSETVELMHISAHTIDDILIYFTESNVTFMGDTYMTNSYPHFYYGGGSAGHLQVLNKALALGDEKTVIVPAHGDLSSNKEALLTYKQNSVRWMTRITELYDQGKTVDEMIEDPLIKQLSIQFNGTQNISTARLRQTLEKTISSDLIFGVEISTDVLIAYEGKYEYTNNKVDEVIWLNEKLFLGRQGFMFELIPLSETKFHIKGQALGSHLMFSSNNNELIYFDGTAAKTATKQ